MTNEKSNRFDRIHGQNRTVYTYNKKKETKMSNQITNGMNQKRLLEVDHYQKALKSGVFNVDKHKLKKEKMKN